MEHYFENEQKCSFFCLFVKKSIVLFVEKETIKRKKYNILWEELLNIVKRGN